MPLNSLMHVFVALPLFGISCAYAQLPDAPGLFGPDVIPGYNFKIRSEDWNTIVNDLTFSVKVPALMWASQDSADGSDAKLVAIRRKSATAINGKVSFKVDINDYVGLDGRAASTWHGVSKLSLENGDDQDVVSEGLAWYLHRYAAVTGVYPSGHQPGLANWSTVTVHIAPNCASPCDRFAFGETVEVLPQGVYVNVEEVNKRFLQRRSLWQSGATWLYKQDDIGLPERKESPDGNDSPTVSALQCVPFVGVSGKGKTRIPDCQPGTIDLHVNMDVMLATGAVNAFSANLDDLLSNEKNFFWADYAQSPKRLYFPWDLDAAIADPTRHVYGKLTKDKGKTVLQQTDHQRVLLKNYGGTLDFRTKYNRQLLALSSAESVSALQGFLTQVQPALTPLLSADPNSKIGGNPAAHFDALRRWLEIRAAEVRRQVCADDPLLCR